MRLFSNIPPGATPLDPDEISGLIPSDISTQGQLNQAEQKNIIRAELWAFGQKRKAILSEPFIRKLHKNMFGDVWKWADHFRQSNKSIGVNWHDVPVELHKLIEDTKYWIKNDTYDWTELAVRFHHRLVWTHPFSNGNGRHARLLTDILLVTNGRDRFTWGGKTDLGQIESIGPMRIKYIAALRDADQKKFKNLIEFVQS